MINPDKPVALQKEQADEVTSLNDGLGRLQAQLARMRMQYLQQERAQIAIIDKADRDFVLRVQYLAAQLGVHLEDGWYLDLDTLSFKPKQK